MLKSLQSLLLFLLTLEILYLQDPVGNAIGPGQKILAGPIEGSGTGTCNRKYVSFVFQFFCIHLMYEGVSE
jgi:hypothetical protein